MLPGIIVSFRIPGEACRGIGDQDDDLESGGMATFLATSVFALLTITHLG